MRINTKKGHTHISFDEVDTERFLNGFILCVNDRKIGYHIEPDTDNIYKWMAERENNGKNR